MTRIWVAAAAFVYEVTGYAQERAEIGRGYVFRGRGRGDGMCGRGGNVNVPNKDMQAGLAAGGYGMKAAAARRGYVP